MNFQWVIDLLKQWIINKSRKKNIGDNRREFVVFSLFSCFLVRVIYVCWSTTSDIPLSNRKRDALLRRAWPEWYSIRFSFLSLNSRVDCSICLNNRTISSIQYQWRNVWSFTILFIDLVRCVKGNREKKKDMRRSIEFSIKTLSNAFFLFISTNNRI